MKALAVDVGRWATITPVKTPMVTAMNMAVRTKSAVTQIFSRINSKTGFSDINHGWVPRGKVEEGKIQEHDPDRHRNRLQDAAEYVPGEGFGAQMGLFMQLARTQKASPVPGKWWRGGQSGRKPSSRCPPERMIHEGMELR